MKFTIKPSEEMLNILREDFAAQNWDCLLGDVFIFPENFLREFIDWYIDKDMYLTGVWYNICMHQSLSEDFIRTYKEHVWWIAICRGQVLSENFINIHKNYLSEECWENIARYQKLSNEFISKNIDFLDLEYLLLNNNISEETKNYIRIFV